MCSTFPPPFLGASSFGKKGLADNRAPKHNTSLVDKKILVEMSNTVDEFASIIQRTHGQVIVFDGQSQKHHAASQAGRMASRMRHLAVGCQITLRIGAHVSSLEVWTSS